MDAQHFRVTNKASKVSKASKLSQYMRLAGMRDIFGKAAQWFRLDQAAWPAAD